MRVGVLGVGKTPHKIQHNKSLRDLAVEAGNKAIEDAGIDRREIQALWVGNVGSVPFCYENSTGLMIVDHLGLVPAAAMRTEAACGTGAYALHLGCLAIMSGLYDTVMVMGAEKMNPRDSMPTTRSICSPRSGSSMRSMASLSAAASLSTVVMS